MLNTSRKRANKNNLTWWYVLKTPWRYLCKTSSRCFEDVWKTSWRCLEDIFGRCLEDVLKTYWRFLEDVLKTSWKRLEDILKMSWRDVWPRWIMTKRPGRCLEEVFWGRKAQANIFVFIKTSSSRQMLAGF